MVDLWSRRRIHRSTAIACVTTAVAILTLLPSLPTRVLATMHRLDSPHLTAGSNAVALSFDGVHMGLRPTVG